MRASRPSSPRSKSNSYRHDFQDHDHACRVVFEWIEAFHNLRRRHSSIGNLSPVDFENQKT
jgi:putative transposase